MEGVSVEDFRSGVELIDRQFHDVLTRLGVEPIAAQGQPFDPNLHQAIQMVETTEVPDHHVIDELQRGYRLRDRVLRAGHGSRRRRIRINTIGPGALADVRPRRTTAPAVF